MSDLLTPESEAEAERIIRSACAEGARLDICGGHTRRGLGRPGKARRVMTSAALSGIVFYEPAEMTIRVRTGTTLEAVEAAIADRAQILPFEPMAAGALWGAAGQSTIGGIVATNLAGPRRMTVGAVRDGILGLRLVNGLGQAIACGGRVMKNVTGLDLTKLNCGAHGTLGFLTEATIKLAPKPEAEETLVVAGLGDAEAIDAMARSLGSPYGVSGAAWLAAGMGAEVSRTLLRLEGFADSVAHRAKHIRAILGDAGEIAQVSGEGSSSLWRSVGDAEFLAEPRDRAIWRVSIAPSRAVAFVTRLGDTALSHAYDWGGGLVWVATAATDAAALSVRQSLAPYQGHATMMRASESLREAQPVFQPPSALELRLSQGLKASFDPGGVLNFGRMFPGV